VEAEAEKREALQEERRRITKENRRKQEEYDKKVAAGKKRMEDLNARFADWYYVIPDKVYRKLHLGRTDIIKKKTASTAAEHGPEDHDHEPASLDEFQGGLNPGS
jgi:hypothetical protein